MKERYRQCAFFQIMEQGRPHQRQTVIDNLCIPSCKEECPIKVPADMEFTEDNAVPYINSKLLKDNIDWATIDKYIQTIRKKP